MAATIGFLSTLDEREDSGKRGQMISVDHTVTTEFDSIVYRPVVSVDVSACMDGAPHYRIEKALWDTGASQCTISEELARRMQLQPVDTGVVQTVTGTKEITYCMIDVYLSPEVVFQNVKALCVPMAHHDVDFLIGMDIASKGSLTISNVDGRTAVSFTDER